MEFIGEWGKPIKEKKEKPVQRSAVKAISVEKNLNLKAQLQDYFGFDDVVIEIDNKSLTHRPDLWGHWGMSIELSAISLIK